MSWLAKNWIRVVRWGLAAGVAGFAVWQLALFVTMHALRVRYPWDVEWLEGAALYQAHRVKMGQVTYGPPNQGYLPLFHPPAYPAMLGYLGKVVRVDYPMARELSFWFIIGGVLLIARQLWLVFKEEENGKVYALTLSLVAAGCVAAGVPLSEGFYDIVREDSMAVFLCVLLAALAHGRDKKLTIRRLLVLASLITLIVYTRLPAVFFPVWVTLFVFARHRKSGLLLALMAVSGCGLVLVALQYQSRGWYWIYTVSLLADHAVPMARLKEGLGLLHKAMPFLPALPVVALGLAIVRKISSRAVLWFGMAVCSLPASLLPFAKVGGYLNDFVPVAFFIGPAVAFLLADLLLALERRPRQVLAVQAIVYAAMCLFFWNSKYSPARISPNADDYKKARNTNAQMSKLKGGVIVPRHPFLPVQNGSRSDQIADMPYLDMVFAGYKDLAVGTYLDKTHAEWAIVTGGEVASVAAELVARYQLHGTWAGAPRMIIATPSTLRYLLRWQQPENDARVLFDFEGPLADWTPEGDAFLDGLRPTLSRGQLMPGAVGKQLLSSYNWKLRDRATGRITSSPFLIDRPNLSLRVGGNPKATRVELHVDGKSQRRAGGVFDITECLVKVVWDVKELMGKEARLVIIDDDTGPYGHIRVDQVVLFR